MSLSLTLISSTLTFSITTSNPSTATTTFLFVKESDFSHSIWRFFHTPHRTIVVSPENPKFHSLAGSCNGVVCLFNYLDRTVCLWNPGINKHLNLDPIPIRDYYSHRLNLVLGFGFNPLLNDYKVVAIDILIPSFPSPYNHQAHVYSVNAGNWRSIEFPSCSWDDPIRVSEGVFVNGFIHWIMYRNSGRVSLTFDMHNEVFGKLGMPPGLGNAAIATNPDLFNAVMDNSLTLLHLIGEKFQYSVLQMKDYGMEESWVVLFKIILPYMGILGSLNRNFCVNVQGKGFIVTSWGNLIVYDEETAYGSLVYGGRVLSNGQAFSYTESLVLLDKFCKSSW